MRLFRSSHKEKAGKVLHRHLEESEPVVLDRPLLRSEDVVEALSQRGIYVKKVKFIRPEQPTNQVAWTGKNSSGAVVTGELGMFFGGSEGEIHASCVVIVKEG